MQTEVGLFIFHVSLPGGCLLLCQFPHLFCTIFFLGYTFGSLVKRAMHQPPMHFLQNAFKHYIFLSRCFIDINYINLLCREICSGVICQLFNKKKSGDVWQQDKIFQILFFVSYRSKVPRQWENRICVWSKSGCCCTRFVYHFSLPV